jgi:hypothetical protein
MEQPLEHLQLFTKKFLGRNFLALGANALFILNAI